LGSGEKIKLKFLSSKHLLMEVDDDVAFTRFPIDVLGNQEGLLPTMGLVLVDGGIVSGRLVELVDRSVGLSVSLTVL
jgi:hypothetical protein